MGWENYGTSRLTNPPKKITDTGIIGDAIRRQRADDRRLAARTRPVPVDFGNVVSFPESVFTIDAIEMHTVTRTAPDGLYEWTINMRNDGNVDTVLVNASCGDGAASEFQPQQGRLFALDGLNVTLLGGSECTVTLQPASYEAEDPFDVSVVMWAKRLATT